MFGERRINLQLSVRAKDFIDRFKAKSNLSKPILALTWSGRSGQTEERWTIGLYDLPEVREGWLGVAPEFEFVVIQDWIFDKIDNKVLDFDEDTGFVAILPRIQSEASDPK